jgi:hypothetical protein
MLYRRWTALLIRGAVRILFVVLPTVAVVLATTVLFRHHLGELQEGMVRVTGTPQACTGCPDFIVMSGNDRLHAALPDSLRHYNGHELWLTGNAPWIELGISSSETALILEGRVTGDGDRGGERAPIFEVTSWEPVDHSLLFESSFGLLSLVSIVVWLPVAIFHGIFRKYPLNNSTNESSRMSS